MFANGRATFIPKIPPIIVGIAINIVTDAKTFITILRLLDITEANIDDFGRFSTLKEKVNREIAKGYIEKLEGEQISAFKLSMKIDSVLRTFVLSDGKE